MIQKTINNFINNQNKILEKTRLNKTKLNENQKQAIVNMIIDVGDFYNEFEKWLNDQGKNNNNGQLDDLYEDFLGDFVNDYVDDFIENIPFDD